MSGLAWDHIPFFGHFRVLLGFFRGRGMLDAHQFLACLIPIGIREFVRIALVDHRDLTRSFFHRLGRRHAHSITVHRNFSRSFSWVIVHIIEYAGRVRNGLVRSLTWIMPMPKAFVSIWCKRRSLP